MMDPWYDPAYLLPPLTLKKALKEARKAGASRLIYCGAEFDLRPPESAKAPAEATRVALFRHPKEKLVL